LSQIASCLYFSPENPNSAQSTQLFCSHAIVERIQSNFLFYAAFSTSPDGYAILTNLSFHTNPLFLVVEPGGDSLSEFRLFVRHQGALNFERLCVYLGIHGLRENNLAREEDREFEEVLIREQERDAAQIPANEGRQNEQSCWLGSRMCVNCGSSSVRT
jgi:hypothetical protein